VVLNTGIAVENIEEAYKLEFGQSSTRIIVTKHQMSNENAPPGP
jgi:hypothetical protein